MKIVSSVANGNWSSLDVWDNGIPDLNDVVYIYHNIYMDTSNNKILDLYILKDGILECDKNEKLNANSIVLIGGQIICIGDNFRIQCNILRSVNVEDSIIE